MMKFGCCIKNKFKESLFHCFCNDLSRTKCLMHEEALHSIFFIIISACQNPELEPEKVQIELAKHEIDQFMLINGFIKLSIKSNGRLASSHNSEVIDGIIRIIENNGGVKVSDLEIIAGLNSKTNVYENENNNSNGRIMCGWDCSGSAFFQMGVNSFLIVSYCSDGCGRYQVKNYWFEGTTLIGVNVWE